MGHSKFNPAVKGRPAWNTGRKLGTKRLLMPQQVWAIRFWLDHQGQLRDRAMFDLAINSKLRGCDVLKIEIGDVVLGGRVRIRATVVQQKTGKPVQYAGVARTPGQLGRGLQPSSPPAAPNMPDRSAPDSSIPGSSTSGS